MEPLESVPTPRTPGHYRVALVCLGNICRSPMADVVLSARVAKAGLSDVVEVVSAGTADYHVGRPMDPRAAATLTASGYDASRHRARQFDATWHDACDLVLVMDAANRRDVVPTARTFLFRDFDPVGTGGEVPDPYYGGDDGFREVLAMVERTSERVVALIAERLSGHAPGIEAGPDAGPDADPGPERERT